MGSQWSNVSFPPNNSSLRFCTPKALSLALLYFSEVPGRLTTHEEGVKECAEDSCADWSWKAFSCPGPPESNPVLHWILHQRKLERTEAVVRGSSPEGQRATAPSSLKTEGVPVLTVTGAEAHSAATGST